MSRTYRNAKKTYGWHNTEKEALKEGVEGYEPGDLIRYSWWSGNITSERAVCPKSKQGKKILANLYRDRRGYHSEPGPAWFRRLYVQRPYRQEAKREIRKYMGDQDYEPMILRKPKLEYWT